MARGVELRDNTNVGPVECTGALPVGARATRRLRIRTHLEEMLQHSRPLRLLLLRLLERPPDAERRERLGLPAALLAAVTRERLAARTLVVTQKKLLVLVIV